MKDLYLLTSIKACYKRNRFIGQLFFWFLPPLFGDHAHTHAHCYPLLESGMSTSLQTIAFCGKDIKVVHKTNLSYNDN